MSATPTILVVDDYRSFCAITAAMLRSRGYKVLTASSGDEAKALVNDKNRIDLLLTDLEMPEMRGDELADWFRGASPETRILFMTCERARVGAPDSKQYLEKPFRMEALFEKVRTALDGNQPAVPEAA